ncbi:MAG: hypothetical protein JWO80_4113 [Bryobacterales bacterium]|nr:hypothetical protein [Bryobacterales bacterium]
MPPEISIRRALIQLLSSQSKEAIIGPMSSGNPARTSAVISATRLLISGLSWTMAPLKSVAIAPGEKDKGRASWDRKARQSEHLMAGVG